MPTSEPIDEITLEPYESRVLSIPVTFDQPGSYALTSVKFRFHRFFPYEQSLARKGRRLHATKQQRTQATYADDTSLTITVEESKPTMTASWDFPSRPLMSGETVPITLHVRNTGRIPIDRFQLFSTETDLISLPSGEWAEVNEALSKADGVQMKPRIMIPRH